MSKGAGVEVARLVLRLAVGGTMVAHGVRHARSLSGTAGWFKSIGFERPELQARASAVVEIGAGAALAAGLATPAAAAAVIGTMAVAARTVHVPNGYFIVDEGYEYVLSLAAASAATGALGAGRYSLDARLGRLGRPGHVGGPWVAAAATALGLTVAAAQLATFWRKPERAEG
ncbi:DoxX family protein [Amycolatopsis rhabdoformis]|uniref:DoxX family protein n=1 Tax=Amycolatopsis rhabdoformis TaxID=1448059 RepID=A0ABZ1IDQ0_9PSEU|nr:DoxX family protein [Amycolatopsis rhabdoformis]WSE32595.1 DoxX family protein [Amycolatopsis rhabdoformis]